MSSREEIKQAAAQLIDDLTFEAQTVDGEKRLLVKPDHYLDTETEFKPLCNIFEDQFGVRYDRARRGWLFKLAAEAAKPKLPQGQQEIAFTTGADERVEFEGKPVQTGIKKIDEKHAVREGFQVLPLAKLTTSPVKVRQSVDAEFVKELAVSVKGKGVLQPILVRPLESGDYQIVMGEQRYRAARDAGLTEIPCIVKKMDDREAFETSLEENLKRKDLGDYEVAKALDHMLRHFPAQYPNQTVLAGKLGKAEKWVSECLSILELENKIPARELMQLTHTQAKNIRAAPPDRQEEIVREAAETGVLPSSREIEAKTRKAAHMAISLERHSPGGVFKEVWYSFGYSTDIPNSHQGGSSPFREEQDWEELIGKDVRRIEESSGYRIIPRVVMDYRTWAPEDTLETLEKEAPISNIPESKPPEVPCSTCSNDSLKGGPCGRERFHVVDDGSLVCEFQNKPLAPKVDESLSSLDRELDAAMNRPPMPPAIPTTLPTPAPVKKGLLWCPVCGDKDATQVREGISGFMICNMCNHVVEDVATGKTAEVVGKGSEKAKEKVQGKPQEKVPETALTPWWLSFEDAVPSEVIDDVERYVVQGGDDRKKRFVKYYLLSLRNFAKTNKVIDDALVEAEKALSDAVDAEASKK